MGLLPASPLRPEAVRQCQDTDAPGRHAAGILLAYRLYPYRPKTCKGGQSLVPSLYILPRSAVWLKTPNFPHDPPHVGRTPDAPGLAAFTEHLSGAGPSRPDCLTVPLTHVAAMVGIARGFVYQWGWGFL